MTTNQSQMYELMLLWLNAKYMCQFDGNAIASLCNRLSYFILFPSHPQDSTKRFCRKSPRVSTKLFQNTNTELCKKVMAAIEGRLCSLVEHSCGIISPLCDLLTSEQPNSGLVVGVVLVSASRDGALYASSLI